ncbi:MAG: isochorismate synthase [Coleofasciculaceae cyanobacterium]
MTVTPYCPNLLQDRQQLYQLLLTSKQQSIDNNSQQIVSISQEVPLLDPLAVLEKLRNEPVISSLKPPTKLQFYLENRGKNEAIAAIDTAISCRFTGDGRFQKTQSFIQNCLAKTISKGQLNLPFSGPHFFCSFTFFPEGVTNSQPFPPATIFLPRWQVSCSHSICVLVANVVVNCQTNLELLLESLCRNLQIILGLGRNVSNLSSNRQKTIIKQDDKNEEKFKSSVIEVLKSIQSNHLNKIVLAKSLDVVSPLPFNLVSSLDKLRQRYPDCYIFSTSNGKGQNFLGASPERLLSISKHQLVTDALAGSAPRGKTKAEDAKEANRLLGSEKERREHQFVLDFIAQRLSQLGLVPQFLPTPQLLQLSNIQHLWTPIQAQLQTDIHPLEILAQLHPTPAVAGVPTQIAGEQIRRYETFDRSLYAAPLGWVDYQGNCQFIVGIRSALIESEKHKGTKTNTYNARLYAGAGIVAGSEPENELAEIQLKLQALLKALL